MQKNITRKSLSICLAGSLFLPGSIAVAADCDFSSEDFFQTATAQIVEDCIQKGQIVINSQDEDGLTPMHSAAESAREPAVISALLEAGADINGRIKGGYTPLHGAAYNNPTPAVISALLAAGADVNSLDEGGRTSLHWAANNNPAPAVISALLAAGADINSQDEGGFTPLHLAASSNPAPAVISALLEAGADPDLVDDEGKSAWDHIQENPELKDTDAYRQLDDLRSR